MYYEMFRQMKKMLGQLDHCLEVAEATAKEKSFDPNLFLGVPARAGPVRASPARSRSPVTRRSSAPRGSPARRRPRTPTPSRPSTSCARAIQAVVAYLDGFSAQDFAGAATVTVTQPRWEGKTMTGADYFLEHVVPNFFFHLTTTYAILRHNGVAVGKRDYLGALTMHAP